MHKWFSSYLINRISRVKIGNILSGATYNKKGVPQGSILVPLLFNLYVNDMYNYADDTLLLISHENFKTAEVLLQEDFNNFQKWSHDKRLIINIKKLLLCTFFPHMQETNERLILLFIIVIV
ncbi:hypothetical protein J437_LFUL004724 [Ladona fulva]|uniref:Reverse transcriptase domain-containing protein n=1 Tax=Ladona fulva TaxID=123851 RepID=A0A8K0K0V8_LADFU|nr:hypothetical protein J437_LFUL004724 [Ladona fulva]